MSWRFPKRMPNPWDPMDVDDANGAMLPASAEVSGMLNEHNFARGAVSSRADVADNVYSDLWQTLVAVDGSTPGATGATVAEVEQTMSWAPIIDGNGNSFAKTLTSREGVLWIMASFASQQEWPGVLYGLFLDGALLEESVWGTADGSDEQVVSNSSTGAHSPGLVVVNRSVSLEATAPVPAGVHVVEVRAASVEGRSGASTQTYRVYARELIIQSFVV